MAVADPGILAQQLATFVTDWRRLQPPPAVPLSRRLTDFVEAWRAIAPPPARSLRRASKRAELSPEQLAIVLRMLKPALEHASSSGAFINVWRIAGLGRSERRTADALAWLLQPRGDHGLGTVPLEGLFDALQAAAPDCPRPLSAARCSIRVEDRPMWSERDRVDLVVDHPELLLFVEIKVDAVEGPDQLRRYVEAAEEVARYTGRPAWRVAYLTRSRNSECGDGVVPLSWRDVSARLRARIGGEASDHQSRPFVSQLLDHFARL